MKKPDRFHRLAEALRLEHIASPWSRQIPMEAWEGIEYRIAKLLRREHAATVRMVQKMRKDIELSLNGGLCKDSPQIDQFKARHHELGWVLDWLNDRRR